MPLVPGGTSGRRDAAGEALGAPSVRHESGDFVFDFELLALKFVDADVVGVGSGFFFGNQPIEVGMLGFESVDMFHRGHAITSFRGSEADYALNANAVQPAL